MTKPETDEADYKLNRSIQNWSWRRGGRKKLANGSPDYGTVSEAATHFKLDPKYVADPIGKIASDHMNPYFFWAGPDDDFSKMGFDHDGE